MPANLTPEYEKAEQTYREAATDEERLEALREMLRAIPKHKGTEKMQADIKRRISQLRKAAAKKGAPRGPDPFHIPKGGAGQVILVGLPNVGKSMLLAATTKAPVKAAEYPFATALPVPGMWRHEDVQIELVDTPPVTAGHVPPGLMGTIRSADIICIVADAAGEPLEQVETVWDLLTGRGLVLRSVPRTGLDAADRNQRSCLIVANKVDLAPPDSVAALREIYADRLEVCPISAATGQGLDALRERLWQLLAVVRVYTKKPGLPPDNDQPFTLRIGSTVEDLAREIHRELPETMKYARIWGEGRFDGQHVQRTEVLRDRDVVEIRG
jgi:ribosome-interacting GTPase 1